MHPGWTGRNQLMTKPSSKKRCNGIATYASWTSYVEMVGLLSLFIRATREGNLQLHLSCIRDMLLWYFPYGKIDYARYLPVYYMEMGALEQTHSTIHSALMDGKFAVLRHQHYGFAISPCDQVIERTFIRDKTNGGMTGITLNKGTTHRWVLIYPVPARVAGACYELSGQSTAIINVCHPELNTTRMVKDEKAVQDVMSTVADSFSNLFCRGTWIRPALEHFIRGSSDGGDQVWPTLGIHLWWYDLPRIRHGATNHGHKISVCKLPLPNQKTFSDIGKTVKSKISLTHASKKESRHLMVRMIVIA